MWWVWREDEPGRGPADKLGGNNWTSRLEAYRIWWTLLKKEIRMKKRAVCFGILLREVGRTTRLTKHRNGWVRKGTKWENNQVSGNTEMLRASKTFVGQRLRKRHWVLDRKCLWWLYKESEKEKEFKNNESMKVYKADKLKTGATLLHLFWMN